jgi:hypothetical protein
MASKTHCDMPGCDATPATDMAKIKVAVPGRPGWEKNRLNVSVVIQGESHDEGEPIGRKDVCDSCRKKLVADAFGMRTFDEYNALRDELNEVILETRRQLALARAGEEPPAEPAPVLVDNDIPF